MINASRYGNDAYAHARLFENHETFGPEAPDPGPDYVLINTTLSYQMQPERNADHSEG